MMFGIVVAASSSIFIAAPILLFRGDRRRSQGRPAGIKDTELVALERSALSQDAMGSYPFRWDLHHYHSGNV